MSKLTDDQIVALAKLREPFEPHQMGKKPQLLRKDDQDKGKCEQGSRYSADGVYCGGYHAKSIHLDYVGHAAITDRLLDVDPEWTWEPLALDEDGLPKFDNLGGLWMRLTVVGMTRLGYGDAGGKSGTNAMKEIVGDGLRNCGMRFGMALELWHRGDLHEAAQDEQAAAPSAPTDPINELKRGITAAGRTRGLSLDDLMKRFAAETNGRALRDAAQSELEAFLASLETESS